MKKIPLWWLLALTAILILAVLVVRPPAWATPLPLVQDATQRLASSPPSAILSAVAGAPTSLTAGAGLEQPDTQVADTPPSDNCIACHTDKKQLKAVAEEPEEVKSEKTSGEG